MKQNLTLTSLVFLQPEPPSPEANEPITMGDDGEEVGERL